ncbi:DUF2637 domain-containing protein [Nocardia mexicana]|uniref:Uncharacterized protein DUF2637 n=1 Tax=Nocardia mexicana TaxID=279262 RepID=A0A370H9G9_9NOCA|nr:DUF2637 domain-containing protein [Nocardia mexicana]RDI53317.1 uncharacterized protein DUF2637 [Nocardia mexicana]
MSSISMSDRRNDRTLWIQCACTAVVALGAAYASYRHGREFALRFGADETTAGIWPLIVDGLLTLATVELWKTGRERNGSGRWAAWSAFVFGICLSLCANIAAAPVLSVFSVVVAACPPLALLLAVELLNRALKRHHADTTETTNETVDETTSENSETDETTEPAAPVVRLAPVPAWSGSPVELTAEQRMWEYYRSERSQGRTPTGAELDRIAGTNNYGRKVLRRWQAAGRPVTNLEDRQADREVDLDRPDVWVRAVGTGRSVGGDAR